METSISVLLSDEILNKALAFEKFLFSVEVSFTSNFLKKFSLNSNETNITLNFWNLPHDLWRKLHTSYFHYWTSNGQFKWANIGSPFGGTQSEVDLWLRWPSADYDLFSAFTLSSALKFRDLKKNFTFESLLLKYCRTISQKLYVGFLVCGGN